MLGFGGHPLRSIALFASCVLVVVLSLRLIALNRANAELRMRAVQPHAGDAVPAFLATTLNGDTLTIGESAEPAARQVLFVLTTTCPFCRATLPVWAQLADSLARLGNGHIRVVAISLDSLGQSRRYAAEHDIRYPVVTLLNDKLRRLYRARWVPQTIVLNSEGVVLFAHVGRIQAGPTLDSVYAVAGP